MNLLQRLNIVPCKFSEASVVASIQLGGCNLFVPCVTEAEALEIKRKVFTYLGSLL
jgi:hypothetical protein